MTNLPQSMKAIDELAAGIEGTVGAANVSTESVFQGRMQLLNAMSRVLKGEGTKGKCSEGDFVFGPPGFVNLGTETYLVPIAKRAHALQLKNQDQVSAESFDTAPKGSPPANAQQEVFSKIANAPKQVKEGKDNYTNMWGNDVLFWSPIVSKFMIYYFHSTARGSSDDAYNLRGTLVRLQSELIPGKLGSWYGPVVSGSGFTADTARTIQNSDGSQTMFGTIDGKDFVFPFPSPTAIKAEIEKFKNPQPQGQETNAPDGRPR